MAGWLPQSGLLPRGRSKKTLLDAKQFFLCAQAKIDESHRDTGTCLDAAGLISANSITISPGRIQRDGWASAESARSLLAAS
jgi:hypothetical protein